MGKPQLYEISVTLRIRAEAHSPDEGRAECIRQAREIERFLPLAATIDAINGDSLKKL